jgi:threonine/homoserine/homoserine lactone efflux protein
MLKYLLIGVVLGLPAGISPGPVLTLVVSETIASGFWGGMGIALAPLITDLPIIVITVFVLREAVHLTLILGTVNVLGGIYIFYLAILMLFQHRKQQTDVPLISIRRGILANALNPNPYIFWLTVGAPTFLRAKGEGASDAIIFTFAFYVSLIGAKVLVALLVSKWRLFLKSRAYLGVNRTLAILLVIFALFLFREGYRLLFSIPR